jgi:hypothetical protein
VRDKEEVERLDDLWWRVIRLKEEEEEEEEEESNPCTGLANPHRTAATEKAVYLLLFLPSS